MASSEAEVIVVEDVKEHVDEDGVCPELVCWCSVVQRWRVA